MQSPYQKFVERVLYPLDVMRRGSRELRILTRLEETERLEPERLHDLRLGALLQLLGAVPPLVSHWREEREPGHVRPALPEALHSGNGRP